MPPIPTPPVTTNAPWSTLFDAVSLVILVIPPILVLPLIPTPPFTTSAPSLTLLDGVFRAAFPTVVIPAILASPPTLIFLPTPTPPTTTNEPVLLLIEFVLLLHVTIPLTSILELNAAPFST